MSHNLDDRFLVQVCSDVDYEELVTYVMFEDSVVFILNCDDGSDITVIEIMDKFTNRTLWKFDYSKFIHDLEYSYELHQESNRDKNEFQNSISRKKPWVEIQQECKKILNFNTDNLGDIIVNIYNESSELIWILPYHPLLENLKKSFKKLIED